MLEIILQVQSVFSYYYYSRVILCEHAAAAHLQSLLSDCAFEIVIPSRDGSGLIDFIVCVKDGMCEILLHYSTVKPPILIVERGQPLNKGQVAIPKISICSDSTFVTSKKRTSLRICPQL